MTVGKLKETMSYREAIDWISFYAMREERAEAEDEEGATGHDFSTPEGIAQILGNG